MPNQANLETNIIKMNDNKSVDLSTEDLHV